MRISLSSLQAPMRALLRDDRRSLRKDREGATAIEFALIAPMLFLLIFGTIEYGLIMFTSAVVEGGTANAARMAKTGAGRSTASNPATRAAQDKKRIEDLIMARGGSFLNRNKLSVIVTPQSSPANTTGAAGEMVTYTATYTWDILTPIMRQYFGNADGQVLVRAVNIVYNEPFDN